MAICMALEQHRRGKIQILAFSLVCGNTTINYQKVNIIRILKLFPDLYGKVASFVHNLFEKVSKNENSNFMIQGNLYTAGRGWYRMCSCQPTTGVVVS